MLVLALNPKIPLKEEDARSLILLQAESTMARGVEDISSFTVF